MQGFQSAGLCIAFHTPGCAAVQVDTMLVNINLAVPLSSAVKELKTKMGQTNLGNEAAPVQQKAIKGHHTSLIAHFQFNRIRLQLFRN